MSEADQSGAGRREVAYRLFASEYDDADFSYSESDEERAPNYVITPTGARVNRLFVVGVLTEVEQVSDDVLRARVVDPTGAFVLYAGQYQPDEQAFLEGAQPPTFVAVTGKARTFQPDDSDQIFTSVRPESINEVDVDTRDRWTVQAAEQTLQRIGAMATALSLDLEGEQLRETLEDRDIDSGLAAGISLALGHYGTTPTYLDALREMAMDAARVVAEQKDEVSAVTLDPDTPGSVTAADLVDVDIEAGVEETDADDPAQHSPGQQADESEASEVDKTTETREPTASDQEPADDESATATPNREPETTDETDSVGSESEDTAGRASTERVETTGGEESDQPETEDGATAVETEEDDIGDFEPGEFELEEETREEIEDEYGTEFQTGSEVDDPGEADIEQPEVEETPAEETATETPEDTQETPDADESEQPATEADGPTTTVTESETEVDTAEDEPDQPADDSAGGGETATQPDDIQAAVVDVMTELDDGDGADREALLDEMTDRYELSREAVEDAIQEALMDGQCYEPDERSLKPI